MGAVRVTGPKRQPEVEAMAVWTGTEQRERPDALLIPADVWWCRDCGEYNVIVKWDRCRECCEGMPGELAELNSAHQAAAIHLWMDRFPTSDPEYRYHATAIAALDRVYDDLT
jgi:hypothetical protein